MRWSEPGDVRLPAYSRELGAGSIVGFHTPDGPDGDGQAWCDACEETRAREGEWNDRSEAFADIRLLCAQCFARARAAIG